MIRTTEVKIGGQLVECDTAARDTGIISRKGAKTQSDGLKPVIPSECEGSKRDFSLRSK